MAETSYYVYALKDPRSTPARPFYIGKGTGPRLDSHVLKIDDSSKGRRISEIMREGKKVDTVIMVDGLSELQALRIEAELIAAFGTEATGGLLTNVVMPSGKVLKPRASLVVPSGVVEKAQIGLALLKDAVLELAKPNREGVTNSDVARALGLRSDFFGAAKDYFTFSLLGMLIRDGKLKRGASRNYTVAE